MRCLHKNIRKDKGAGIEGLPLQLMIMVVVAGLGLTIILGWMGNLSMPNGIDAVYSNPLEITVTDADHDGVYSRSNIMVTISVVDLKGEPVSGATVVMDGCNVNSPGGKQVHGTTDDSGKVTFSGLSASQTGKSVGFITVTVTKSGWGTDTSLTIPVISE
jgi:hypothetical protein